MASNGRQPLVAERDPSEKVGTSSLQRQGTELYQQRCELEDPELWKETLISVL